MKETLLQLKNATVQYGGVTALDNASVAIDEGELVALMGPNGAGKSTVIKAIFGLAPLANGEVLWHEHAINPVPHEVVKRGISYVPQGRQVFTSLTVRENLEMGGFALGNKSQVKSNMENVLDFFPALQEGLEKKAGTLSGGQQQMLALGRGLMVDPKVLMLDEPSLGLAPKIVKEVFARIKEINESRNTAILVVEHNVKSLLEVSEKAYVLSRGRVAIEENDPGTLLEDNRLEEVFLGRAEHARA